MSDVRCFAPVGNSAARILILGSMPGIKSLEQHQYYAHPANVFWKIMGELVGACPDLPYAERLRVLQASGIALWDVLASCERKGSLDANIRQETANDFTTFLALHPHIAQICFNGSAAEQCFHKFVLRKQVLPPLQLRRLPSTSPAHAGMRYTDKLHAWRGAICS